VSRYVPHVRVINGGDGQHQHPTQGLLDAFTIRQILSERLGSTGRASGSALFEGLKILIVGDVRHSRVARSDVAAYVALGAEVRVAAPGTLLPEELESWPVTLAGDFDDALAWADVVGLLRLQRERGSGSFVPTLREFTTTYGLTLERAQRLRPETVIMHPGPINRGVEIDSSVADLPCAVIDRQVANGVPVRMAVLYLSVAGSKGEAP
jgi:aspartate carbamoyltransferase catalytic subunit